jgi:hypothetical protein
MTKAFQQFLSRLQAPAPRRRRGSHSQVEKLEVRILPSATAVVSKGTLTINGDNGPNDLVVQNDVAGVKIIGQNGTLISVGGQPGVSSVILTGVTSIKGNFGDGADKIKIADGLTLKNVTLSMGDGDSDVDVENVNITGKIDIKSANGDDRIQFQSMTAKTTTVNTGFGDDDVEFKAAAFNGSVTVNTGAGEDDVESDSGTGGTFSHFNSGLTINTGDDDDTVGIRNTSTGKLTIDMGDGDDSLDIDTLTTQGVIVVKMGAGADGVSYDAVQQNGSGTSSIDLGSGNDSFDLKTSTFAGNVTADLGTGFQNEMNIDDVGVVGTTTLNSSGKGDKIYIELDTGRSGFTQFGKSVKANVGLGADLKIGVNNAASYTKFLSSVSINGVNPHATLAIATLSNRIELASEPDVSKVDVTAV